MKLDEARMIAENTACPGCKTLAQALEEHDGLDLEVIRDQQRKLRFARSERGEAKGKAAQQVRDILAAWKREHPVFADSAAEPGSKRWKQVEARLAGGCSVEDCKLAPIGAKRNAWHQAKGRNGKPRCDVNHIFASEQMVEDLAALARNQPRNQPKQDGPRGIQAVLDRLEGARQVRPDEWQACCPAHDDRHASLRVGQGDKGVVVKCMAGCDTARVIGELGLEMGALFDRDEAPARIRPKTEMEPLPTEGQLEAFKEALASSPVLLERLEAVRRWTLPTLRRLGVGWDARRKRLVFPVHDAQGELVQVVDYSPKPPQGQRKIGSLRGRPRELWPAPESLESPELLLVEGEPDAVSGHELGFAAVGVPGASIWKPSWPQRFEGRRVLICMDCDGEGRRAARVAFEALRPVVPYVRVIDLDRDRSDKYDLSDFLCDGGTAERLRHPELVLVAV